jgi:nicotinate phosphoribosyltransferase
MFGVGEALITSKSDPVFGGVYKLTALVENGEYIPKIKVSETPEKITTPHFKNFYRLFDNDSGKAVADYITLHDEIPDTENGITIFDPVATWKKKHLTNVNARPMLEQIYKNGKRVYDSPPLGEIKQYCQDAVGTLWDEVLRFEYPHKYYVDLSQKLWNVRDRLLNEVFTQSD